MTDKPSTPLARPRCTTCHGKGHITYHDSGHAYQWPCPDCASLPPGWGHRS